MAITHIAGDQTALISGPAKIDTNSVDAPLAATRAAPTLGSIAPTSAAVTDPEFLLTCTGTNFTQFSRIMIGSVVMPTNYVSPTSLTCGVNPANFVAGPQTITVRNGSLVSAPQTLTFT